MSKRPGSPPPPPGGALIKRARGSPAASDQQVIAISSAGEKEQGLVRSIKRTSALEAPIVSLSGSHSVRSSLSFTHITKVHFVSDSTVRNSELSFRPVRTKHRRMLGGSECLYVPAVLLFDRMKPNDPQLSGRPTPQTRTTDCCKLCTKLLYWTFTSLPSTLSCTPPLQITHSMSSPSPPVRRSGSSVRIAESSTVSTEL